jgi:GT2 family glycosyltransferase
MTREVAPPRLSIVVPTHDTRALTLRCLATVRADLPADAELIVVDDGSQDGTAEAVATQFPTARLLCLDHAHGFTVAANAGLAAATGEILLLLNSDTEVPAGTLARLVRAFAEDRRMGVAGAELVFPDGRPQWSGGRAPDARWLFALASGIAAALPAFPGWRRWRRVGGHGGASVDWVPGAAMALRADAWRATGPFDAAFQLYAQDVDLCLRVRDAGWRVAVIAGARVVHHGGASVGQLAGSTTGRQHPERLWSDLARVMLKRGGEPAGRTAVRALRAGAALRVLVRRVATPFVPPARRAAWRRDTEAYARAGTALAYNAASSPATRPGS